MRVLIASQYFPPEITAGATRLHTFAAGLALRGHRVEVICELPSHPAGVVEPGYRGRPQVRRHLDGFDVSHVWVRATPSKSSRARLANFASFAASATVAGSLRRRPDVVLASSPPLSVGSVGRALALRHRVPWVLDVRDLWPDVAVVIGELSDGRLLRFSERLERGLYRDATAITATTETFENEIAKRGGAGKITLVRNGAAAPFLDAGGERPDDAALAQIAGPAGGRFTWAYAGNIGLAQGLEAAVEAAAQLGDGFRLLLLGDGARRQRLRELASGLPPGSVVFADPIPPREAARALRACDALLVALAPLTGLEGFVPSKLFDCAALGLPLVVAARGEASQLAEQAQAAVCVAPGDARALAGAVRDLRDQEALRRSLAAAARAFGEANSRERGVELLERVLAGAVEGAR